MKSKVFFFRCSHDNRGDLGDKATLELNEFLAKLSPGGRILHIIQSMSSAGASAWWHDSVIITVVYEE